MKKPSFDPNLNERGNILFMILIAIAMIGLLTAAIQYSSGPEGANIDKESLVIRVSEVQRYAGELERAVNFVLQNGKSESELRFAHPEASEDYGDLKIDPDLTDQIFHRSGGGANYTRPPRDVNDGSSWEFYGGTHLPGIGTDKPELVAVLPGVTQQFCDKINALNGQSGQPLDTGSASASKNSAGECINLGPDGRFNDNVQFYDPPRRDTNNVEENSFDKDPVYDQPVAPLQGCIQCVRDGRNHFYHVLLAR